ncbi:MAG: ATP-binding protein [Anaerolineales bacterium]|jgi:two-component system NtrC family sensor kinase
MGSKKADSKTAPPRPGRALLEDSRRPASPAAIADLPVAVGIPTDLEGLRAAASESLAYILQAVKRPGGALLIQTEEDPKPVHIAMQNPPASWRGLPETPDHPLMKVVRTVLTSGKEGSADPGLDLAAALPLLARSSRQGILLVAGAPLTAAEHARLVELARAAGRTVKISRSSQALHTADKELASLHMIATILASNLELDEVQKAMVEGVQQILDCEIGFLILVDESLGQYERKVMTDGPDWIRREILPLGDGWISDCMRATRPIRVDRAEADPRLCADAETTLGIQLRSNLCAPLRAGNEPIGLLDMLNKRGGPFSPYDQELISLLATSIADAVYNQRLIQQMKVVNIDLKSSREELLNSRNTLRALFDNVPASLYIVDRAYALRAINRSRAKRARSRPNLLVSRCCYEALFERIAPCTGCLVAQTLHDGQSTTRALRLADAEGEAKEWEISTYPILDEYGEVVQVVLFEEDVTERRRLEANLAQSEKLAAVGQLAAGVAHEINNPLTAVIANAQLMQRAIPPDSDLQESVELILIAGSRAAQVVRNLLDFARKEQYRFDLMDVNETIRRTLELVQHEVISRSITLKFEPDPDLPRVLASSDHLQGVWLNLLLNAFDALDGKPGEIRVSTRRQPREVQVMFEDSGKGILPENLPRIFEPFFTTKLPGQGTGLGLSVCHQVIKQHNGRILVDSEIGRGTKFTVVLPVP